MGGLGGVAAVAAGWWHWPAEGLLNPCYARATPAHLLNHELVRAAWEGVDARRFWDCHMHLVGVGDSGSGIYLHPSMQDVFSPMQYARYRFYINAACAAGDAGNIDRGFVHRLARLIDEFPQGARVMLLAFDYHHDSKGVRDLERSPFHTPDVYAAAVAGALGARGEWIASIHPYRPDCIEAVQGAVDRGARAIKWLPPVMGIDPGDARCDAFYEALVRHDVPLLTHAGDEHAVDGVQAQALGNPLLLRRPLEHGVRVIVAHCACEGHNTDLDKGRNGPQVENFELFARLMDEPAFAKNLFGEISAMTQLNRVGRPLQTVIRRRDWHPRLINGSDYPLPGVMPLFSNAAMAERGYITRSEAAVLAELRRYNPLLFDFVLKRTLRFDGQRLDPQVFESRRLFV